MKDDNRAYYSTCPQKTNLKEKNHTQKNYLTIKNKNNKKYGCYFFYDDLFSSKLVHLFFYVSQLYFF